MKSKRDVIFVFNLSWAFSFNYQIVLVLKGVVKVGDPASISADKDIALLVETSGFSPFQHHPLVEDLHGVDALSVT
jgi:hypothetical protein